jgi:hypothetical protein
MAPRPDPQDDLEAGRGAQVGEGGHVEVAVEAGDAGPGHVVIPEDVAGGHGDAARAHLPQPLRPAVPRGPAVVDLAGDRDHRAAAEPQAAVGELDPGPGVGHRRESRRPGPGVVPHGEGGHEWSSQNRLDL